MKNIWVELLTHNSILLNIFGIHHYSSQVCEKSWSIELLGQRLMQSVTFQYSKGYSVARLEPCTND